MILSSLLLFTALQTAPLSGTLAPIDGHQELRDRPPREQDQPEAEADPASLWLAQCLALIEEDASRAHTMAQIKRNEAIGAERVLANHCLGLAATQLALWDDASTAFLAARDGTPEGELRARARFGTMAGNAALAKGDVAQAEALLIQAKSDASEAASAPLQAIAASDLARVLVAQGRNEAALAELDLAISLMPETEENWLLKATLLRRMDQLVEAQAAIEEAATRGPTNPQIALEAGVIAVLAGRDDAARSSWQSAIALAPQSDAAQQAQDYIAQLGPAPTTDQTSQ